MQPKKDKELIKRAHISLEEIDSGIKETEKMLQQSMINFLVTESTLYSLYNLRKELKEEKEKAKENTENGT